MKQQQIKRTPTQADLAAAKQKVSMLGNGQQIRLDSFVASWTIFKNKDGKTYIGYKPEDAYMVGKFFKNKPELEFVTEGNVISYYVQAL